MATSGRTLSADVRKRPYHRRMKHAPIILVPGFWLGAWAWDEVAGLLRADGADVTALTLPGLDSVDTDRSSISAADHVDAICTAIEAADGPVLLAVHSGTGFAGYAASDRLPDRIAAMVYVDSGPGIGAMDPDFADVEMPMPSPTELEENENLDGLSPEQLATFRERAVPEPGGVVRGTVELTNDARGDIPTTMICTAFPSDAVKAYAAEQNPSWLAGLAELRDVTWVDLPTSHWVMWSRPVELARIIGDVASAAAPGA
jgi:pimeloyl-ACP methyl ester carboxylesterase